MKKILLTLVISIGFSYSQNWNIKFLLKDTLQGGTYPSVVIDNIGDLHILYWNQYEDKLIYAHYFTKNDSLVSFYVDSTRNGGYPNKIFISDSGKIYCAFMENVGGKMKPRFAKLVNNKWFVEEISNRNFGEYGPIHRTQPLWVNASIDLYVNEKNNHILVAMFNGFHSIADFKYDFQMYLGYKINNNWTVGSLPDIPSEITQYEGIAGERFGEFCNIIYDTLNTFSIYTIGSVDGTILKLSGYYGDTLLWKYTILDSVARIKPLQTYQKYWGIFEGLNVKRTDSITHLVYASVEKDFSNVAILPNFHSLIYAQEKDSIYQTHFIVPTDTGDMFLDPYIYVYNNDTLIVSYCNYTKDAYYISYSYDGGNSWNSNLIYTTDNPFSTAPIVMKDTVIYVLLFDNLKEKLILLKSSIYELNNWEIRDITYNTNYATELSADFTKVNDSIKYGIFFTERNYNKLLYMNNDTIIPVDIQNKNYYDLNMFLDYPNVYLSYTDGVTDYVKLTTILGLSHLTEVVDFSVNASQSSVMHNLNNTYCTYVSTYGLHFATKSLTWNYSIIDSSGFFPKIFLYKNLPTVCYYNLDSSGLFLSIKNNNSWNIQRITDSSIVPTFAPAYDITTNNDTLLLAFQTPDNLIYYAYKVPDSSWKYEIVTNTEIGIIGNKININVDATGRPWIIYSILNDAERIGLSVKLDDNTWYSVFVPYPLTPPFSTKVIDDKLLIISKYKESNTISALTLTMLDSLSSINPTIYSNVNFYKTHKVNIFPNPTKKTFYVETPLYFNEMKILDIHGRNIPFEYTTYSNKIKVSMDASNGLYFVILKSNEGLMITKKLIIQH